MMDLSTRIALSYFFALICYFWSDFVEIKNLETYPLSLMCTEVCWVKRSWCVWRRGIFTQLPHFDTLFMILLVLSERSWTKRFFPTPNPWVAPLEFGIPEWRPSRNGTVGQLGLWCFSGAKTWVRKSSRDWPMQDHARPPWRTTL
jgi:hypothetical protein